MCSVALLGSNPRETTMWSKTVPWTTLTLAPARRASPSARSLGLTTQPHRRPTRTHETNLRGSWFPQNTSLIAESGLHLSSTSGPAISNPLDPEFLNAGGSDRWYASSNSGGCSFADRPTAGQFLYHSTRARVANSTGARFSSLSSDSGLSSSSDAGACVRQRGIVRRGQCRGRGRTAGRLPCGSTGGSGREL
jgi:hypothetical protein